MRVLILDNYDSFVWNIADYIGKLGAEPFVVRSTRITLEKVWEMRPDRIVLSPGPGHPSERRFTGISADVVREVSREIPTLGVCMGMQLIAYALGGEVVRAKRVLHGKSSKVLHDSEGPLPRPREPSGRREVPFFGCQRVEPSKGARALREGSGRRRGDGYQAQELAAGWRPVPS